MEVVPVIQTVTATISLAETLLGMCRGYLSSHCEAPEIVTKIVADISIFEPQLRCLRSILRDRARGSDALVTALSRSKVLEEADKCLAQLNVLAEPRCQDEPASTAQRMRIASKWLMADSRKAKEILQQLERHRSNIGSVLVLDMHTTQHEVKKGVLDLSTRAVWKWLKPKIQDMYEVHLLKQDIQEDETCNWMTDSDLWKQWLAGGEALDHHCRRFLWIHGIAGSGKTILASCLIDDARKYCGNRGVAYYYCSFENLRDETRFFLRWIIWDFCRQLHGPLPQKIIDHHRSRDLGTESLLECLQAISEALADLLARKTVQIIIDGVDESKTPRGPLLNVLTTIGTRDEFSRVSLLMVSRKEPDIEQSIDAAIPESDGHHSQNSTQSVVPPSPKRSAPSHENDDRRTKRHSSSWSRGIHARPSSMSPHRTKYRVDMSTLQGSSQVVRQSSPGPVPTFPWTHEERHLTVGSSVVQRPRGNSSPAYSDMSSSESFYPTKTPSYIGQAHPILLKDDRPSFSVSKVAINRQTCTILSMSNSMVAAAIQTYIQRRLSRLREFKSNITPDQAQQIEDKLVRGAKGMFRWAACQIDLIQTRRLYTKKSLDDLLSNLPATVFETYERIISQMTTGATRSSHDETFARTALALVCSDSAEIPDAGVLAEASRFNVPLGAIGRTTVDRLSEILGCLIQVTPLRKKPQTVWQRDDEDASCMQRISPAHYTVKEFMFAKRAGDCTIADEFVLTKKKTQTLELQVVFHGLQRDGTPRPSWEYHRTPRSLGSCDPLPSSRKPTLPSPYKWKNHEIPAFAETSTLINLILLKWPELTKLFLGSLTPDTRMQIFLDHFLMQNPKVTENYEERRPQTVLQLCVWLQLPTLLEILIDAGADVSREPNIVFLALSKPYEDGDGSTTGRLLTLLLEAGANPNPAGFRFTPLQLAVRNLEEQWVHTLMAEYPNPNAVGEKYGEHPWYTEYVDEEWYDLHVLKICRSTIPNWDDQDGEDVSDQVHRSRDQIRCILESHGAVEPQQPMNEVVEISDDDFEMGEDEGDT
ncbi:hypothetical protein JX265_007126 [Neoarthrinium moseri]|uniref:Nephrocystin 3-like N-terminal domain-containing protein n=1 Tax=Neoarthrinium moseri TaxID=1658444 RepID=A0A9Q0APT5_9PEZI|nr:hypothetical protein JX265_007126 [Neoarthrinium moseri]